MLQYYYETINNVRLLLSYTIRLEETMTKNPNIISGLMFGICEDIEFPTELRDFLDLDDQGIEGFDFMLTNPDLSKKIPRDVRMQYEILYSTISLELSENIAEMIKLLNEIESNPKETIHELIRSIYVKNKD